MKVETPQILWHSTQNGSQKDNGKNSPILSCSLFDDRSKRTVASSSSLSSLSAAVLATAGGSEVNLWRVADREDGTNHGQTNVLDKSIDMDHDNSTNTEPTQIVHILTLSRGTNERTINGVKFSPDGCHLAAVGDGGSVMLWSLPPKMVDKEKSNVGFLWACHIQMEKQLQLKLIFNQSDDVMDIAWSSDSKRFLVGSLDHTFTVYELITQQQQVYSNANDSATNKNAYDIKIDCRPVHRSTKDHTHYIQGVAYDPQGVYLASQGSDRMVKVYMRKNLKDKDLKEASEHYDLAGENSRENDFAKGDKALNEKDSTAKLVQSRVIPELLTRSKFDLQNKVKTIKFFNSCPITTGKLPGDIDTNMGITPGLTFDADAALKGEYEARGKDGKEFNARKHHMFADELTVGSFFRRLAFTVDGAFLIVPAALWHGSNATNVSHIQEDHSIKEIHANVLSSPNSVTRVADEERLSEPSFATYLFARHHFDHPYKVLAGLEKPSVVVRPNPILFKLTGDKSTSDRERYNMPPYRSIFAILTIDTVLIYDTSHDHPLALARGLHYAGLTDATWSADGRKLFVTSSDGYISILSFAKGELGDEYHVPTVSFIEKRNTPQVEEKDHFACGMDGSTLHHEANSPSIYTLTPKKKKKKVTLNLALNTTTVIENTSNVLEVEEPIIHTLVPKKKIKGYHSSPQSTYDNAESNVTDNILPERSFDDITESKEEKINFKRPPNFIEL